jgi:hypothetical protein
MPAKTTVTNSSTNRANPIWILVDFNHILSISVKHEKEKIEWSSMSPIQEFILMI